MAVLRVTEAFVVFVDGNPEFYNPGELVDENDPVVKGRGALFGPEVPLRVVRVSPKAPAPARRRGRTAKKATSSKPAKKAAPKKATSSDEDESSSEVL